MTASAQSLPAVAALLTLLAFSSSAGNDAERPPGEEAADDDRTPLHTVVPVYPESARRERLQGEVQVCFHIDRAGNPYRIAVRSSTHRIFERPAIRAVRASTYVPLASDEPLPTIKSCRTFRFSLEPVQDS